jgi:hypothetical protein
MTKKVREQNKWTIPSDWNEAEDGYLLYTLCLPNSRQWRGIFVGHISDLAYGRNYNKLTGTITEAQAIAREVFESMGSVCLDDILVAVQCLCRQTTIVAESTEEEAGDIDTPPFRGAVSVGPGEQFPDTGTYYDAKCNAANAIYDTVLGSIDWLRVNDVDMLAGLFGGVTTGLIIGLTLAGPVGWAVEVAGSVIGLLAGFLIRYSLDFVDVKSALVEMHEECVAALYAANSASGAESAFLAAVDDATQPITAVERQLLGFIMSNEMLNQLFDIREDVANYQSPDPIDCGAVLIVWTFPTDVESWTFVDDSDGGGYSASVQYDSDVQALDVTLILTTADYHVAAGRNISPAVSQAVGAGNAIQVDYAPHGDDTGSGIEIIATYADTSKYSADQISGYGSGTFSLPLTVTGTLTKVEVISKQGQGIFAQAFTTSEYILEVRVV